MYKKYIVNDKGNVKIASHNIRNLPVIKEFSSYSEALDFLRNVLQR